MHGSNLFSVQSKINDVVRATKVWCLDFKKHLGLNWSLFETELLAIQENIASHRTRAITWKKGAAFQPKPPSNVVLEAAG